MTDSVTPLIHHPNRRANGVSPAAIMDASNSPAPASPLNASPSTRRFTVQERTPSLLSILVSEEVDHVPVRWRSIEYSLESGTVLGLLAATCELAQIRAFCSTYLQRFPEPSPS